METDLGLLRLVSRQTIATEEVEMDEGKSHEHKELYRCLGNLIVLRRKRLGMSQEDLAEASGVDRSFISSVERSKRRPSFGVVASIAHGLRMRYARLVTNCEECAAEKTG